MKGKQQYKSLADLCFCQSRQFAVMSGAQFLTDPVQPSTPEDCISSATADSRRSDLPHFFFGNSENFAVFIVQVTLLTSQEL